MTQFLDNIEQQIPYNRALKLSKSQKDENEQFSVLEFKLMGEKYAIVLNMIDAVFKIVEIFTIPLIPKHISGVIRHKGASIAIVDLPLFFHSKPMRVSDKNYAILVNVKNVKFSLQSEEIEGVRLLKKEKILSLPDNFDRFRAPYLSGITEEGLAILDLEQLVMSKGFGTVSVKV